VNDNDRLRDELALLKSIRESAASKQRRTVTRSHRAALRALWTPARKAKASAKVREMWALAKAERLTSPNLAWVQDLDVHMPHGLNGQG
jgi:hypothetical protein